MRKDRKFRPKMEESTSSNQLIRVASFATKRYLSSSFGGEFGPFFHGTAAMMDSFELNKIMGAILGTLLVLLSVNIVVGGIFHVSKPAKPGYDIAVTEAPSAGVPAAPKKEVPIAQLLASADVKKGEAISKKCMACHDLHKGGPNKVGPDLYGVVGRERGKHEGFSYSSAMEAKSGKWTFEDLNHFLTSPRSFIPGTKMAFAGISKDQDRADLIAYLNTNSANPLPLPKAEPAADQKAEAPKGGDQKAPAAAQNAAPAPAPQGGQPTAPAPQGGGQPKAPAPAAAPKQ
jgi:cytochrome c